MNDSQIVLSLKQIFEKKKEIKDLAESRRLEEEALVVEFRVNECNTRRNEIMTRYNAQINALNAEIRSLEESLGDKA